MKPNADCAYFRESVTNPDVCDYWMVPRPDGIKFIPFCRHRLRDGADCPTLGQRLAQRLDSDDDGEGYGN